MGYDLRAGMHQYTRDPDAAVIVVDTTTVVARVRRGRVVRTAMTGAITAAATVVVAAAAYGLASLPTTDSAPVVPASPSASAVHPSATPPPTPTAPTPTSAPGPTPTARPADPGAAEVPVFRTGARVSGFPANAPEGPVVEYLTGYLGVQPEAEDPDYACPSSALPGRILLWPGTGVGVRVRTTDDAGNTVDPYIAAWTLMEPSAALGLATDAGLTAGAPRERVLEVYPDATRGEDESGGGSQWWYSATDAGGSILVIGVDEDPIHRIESGYGCGE